MKDVHVTMTFRNNRILSKMGERGIANTTELCRQINASLGTDESKSSNSSLGKLINMKEAAKKSNGDWVPEAIRLANFFQCVPEDLFSSPQQHGSLRANVAEAQLSFSEIQQLTLQPPIDPEVKLQALEFKSIISKTLGTLTAREERVIRMRFGIGYAEHTLEEVGQSFGLTRERIREIEARALRKLKHPTRIRDVAAAACTSEIVKNPWGGTRMEHTIDQSVMDALRES